MVMDRIILIYYRDIKGKTRHWGHHCKGAEAERIHKQVANIFAAGYAFINDGAGTTTHIPVHQIVSIEIIECEQASESSH